MKIKEVIYEESFLDKIKKAIQGDERKMLPPDAPFASRVTRATQDGDLAELGKAGAKLWLGTVQRLERQNQGPLSDSQYQKGLTDFVDGTLLGRYPLRGLQREYPEAYKEVDTAVRKVLANRQDAGVWRDSFTRIAATVATIVPDMAPATPGPQPPRQGGVNYNDTRPFDVDSGNIARIPGPQKFELDLNKPDQRAIYDKIRREFLDGELQNQ